MTQRQKFINFFFKEIISIDYVFLKFTEESLSEIEEYSDLDILLDEEAMPIITSVIQAFKGIENIDRSDKASMTQFFIFFEDASFIQVDCLFQLVRKHLVYLPNEYLREKTSVINGIKTYTSSCLLEHLIFFHQLNYSGLPEKYLAYFEALPSPLLSEIFQFFNQKYETNISLADLRKENPLLRKRLIHYLNKQTFNSTSNKLINTYLYIKNHSASIFTNSGKVITFSGVDGAGKSTILAETKLMLEKKFRKKVIVLRHRPSLLPILSSIQYGKSEAEKRSARTLPRQGTNKNKFSSLIRFIYYFIDYFIGQWYIFFRYQMMNYIVLYDRYYFDFIVDGKRSNIRMNSNITTSLYRFIHKPQLNFFLYAPPQVILERKKELSANDINSLTSNYQNLFTTLSENYDQKYLPIKNINKTKTLERIQKELQHFLAIRQN